MHLAVEKIPSLFYSGSSELNEKNVVSGGSLGAAFRSDFDHFFIFNRLICGGPIVESAVFFLQPGALLYFYEPKT